MGMICTDIKSIFRILKDNEPYKSLGIDDDGEIGSCIVATSGGFDPLHVGHVRCIREAANIARTDISDDLGNLVVIVNGDGFLQRKKGYIFMPLKERMEIIAALEGVDFVVPWDDGTQFVTGALEQLMPAYFAKGGDRSTAENVPEFEVCKKIDCEVLFGIGGSDKAQSSSDLVKKMKKNETVNS